MNGRLWSAGKAKEYLGLGSKAFKAAKIPFIQVGKTKKYTQGILDTWLEINTKNPAQYISGRVRLTGGIDTQLISYAGVRELLTAKQPRHL